MSAPVRTAPIIQYWDEEQPPSHIRERMATFRHRHPGLRHLAFDERRAARLIAERIGARQARAFATCAMPAMQADYFRYCAVYATGGIYADANLVPRRDLRSLLETDGALFEVPGGPVLNGLFAFRDPGHPLLEMAIEVATQNVEKRLSPAAGLTTGPAIFTALVRTVRGDPFERGRVPVTARMRPHLELCWEELVDSVGLAVEMQARPERALDGVAISSFHQGKDLVDKPPGPRGKGAGRPHWSHWEGPAFRELADRDVPRA